MSKIWRASSKGYDYIKIKPRFVSPMKKIPLNKLKTNVIYRRSKPINVPRSPIKRIFRRSSKPAKLLYRSSPKQPIKFQTPPKKNYCDKPNRIIVGDDGYISIFKSIKGNDGVCYWVLYKKIRAPEIIKQQQKENRERQQQKENRERQQQKENRERQQRDKENRERQHKSKNNECLQLLCTNNIRDDKSYLRWILKNHPDKNNNTNKEVVSRINQCRSSNNNELFWEELKKISC